MAIKTLLWLPLLALAWPAGASAQEPGLPLEACIRQALTQNRGLQASRADISAGKQLKTTALDIPKTSVTLQRGQYNSYVRNDNNINVSQQIPFPTLLGAQAKLAGADVRSSELQLASDENNLVYQVKAAWYQLQYLHALQTRLEEQDTVYVRFERAAGVKLKTGESNLLEKTTAENQRQLLQTQIQQVKADIRIYETRLQTLMHSEAPVKVEIHPLEALNAGADSSAVAQNPGLQWFREQTVVMEKRKQVEKNKMLPDLTVGFFTQTLIGTPMNATGATMATKSDRFNGFEAGIAIPLWFKPQAAKIKAAGLHQQAAAFRYEQQQQNYNGMFRESMGEARKFEETLRYYDASLLPQTKLMTAHAGKAYASGEIGYVEYLQSLRTAMETQTSHLETLNNYNQRILHLQYLAGNK